MHEKRLIFRSPFVVGGPGAHALLVNPALAVHHHKIKKVKLYALSLADLILVRTNKRCKSDSVCIA
jgi:hypothetical protein